LFRNTQLLGILPGSPKAKMHNLRTTVVHSLNCLTVPSRMITFRLGDLPFSWQDQF
jgi:hypothetical protein